MAERVLVLGGAGMAGHQLWRLFDDRGDETWATVRGKLDGAAADVLDARRVVEGVDLLTDDGLEKAFRIAAPTVVVNAAGVVKQRDVGPAELVAGNAMLPHRVAARCAAAGARLVHLSTDCVFSGERPGGMYREEDRPDPVDAYGHSKLLGEVDGPGCLTLRTSIVGPELSSGYGLLSWLATRRGQSAPGWRLAFFSGVSTPVLAAAVADLVDRHPELHGVWHLAGPRIDKASLLALLAERLALDVRVVPEDGTSIDRSLDGSRLMERTGWQAPSWDQMAAELAHDGGSGTVPR